MDLKVINLMKNITKHDLLYIRKSAEGFVLKNSQHKGFKILKGTVSRDFLLLVFFLNQFPPSL
jgi:hypothetical protein